MSIEWQCNRFFLRLWPELSQKCVETEKEIHIMNSSNKAERVFHEQISRSEEKEHMAGQIPVNSFPQNVAAPKVLRYSL